MAYSDKTHRVGILQEYVSADVSSNVNTALTVVEQPIPKPQKGQLLVKMAYASINPSDTSYVRGNYGVKPECPAQTGFEGCGIVVAAGGGIFAGSGKVGKKVAFYALGTWAEYCLVEAKKVMILPNDMDMTKAAAPVVNPLTCLAFIDCLKSRSQKVVVHTAAASSLGKMLIRQGLKEGIQVICVVRKAEQEEMCKKEGATMIVNSSKEGWMEKLKGFAAEHKANTLFDAVAGSLTADVLRCMPNNSTAFVYGGLSGRTVSVGVDTLIFEGKTVEGFWLQQYLAKKYFWTLIGWFKAIPKMLQGELSSNVHKIMELNELADAVKYYNANMGKGKTIVKCFKGDDIDAKPL